MLTLSLGGALNRLGPASVGTSNVVDLFIVCGQSNALGEGDSNQSPSAPNGLYINGSTITSPLIDPMGNVNTGSAWPSFSNEWASRTGRKSAFVYQGVVGASLIPAGTGWNPTGNLRAQAVTAAQAAITAIGGSAVYTLGSVYFLWLQGEQEASLYDGTSITPATYSAALGALADYFKTNVPSMVKMGIVQICGTGTTLSISPQDALHTNYELIRSGNSLAVADANLVMLYDGSHHGVALNGLKDGTHYAQWLYNLVGRMSARQLANPRVVPQPGLASPLAATPYPDTFSLKSGRTVSLSTNASTTCLIVAVASSFPGTNVAAGLSCTFNGVTMKAAALTNTASNSPAGNATAEIFILDSNTYGSSVGGIAGTLVVSCANNQKLIDICAIEMAGVIAFVDTEGGDFPAPATPGVAITSVSVPAIYYQSLVVVASAGITASATPFSWSSASLTKDMDHGVGDGSTTTSQTAVGHFVENSPSIANRTYTITYTGNCTHTATVAIALRQALDGEIV